MVQAKSSAKGWIVGILIVLLVVVGAYVFIKNRASADIMPPLSNAKSFSKTVVAATLLQDYTSGATQGTYMNARITEGTDSGRQIFVAIKKNATTFTTPSSGSFYSSGTFCGSFNACATLKKGDKILVSGDLINGFLKYPLIAADSITLTTKRANASVGTRGAEQSGAKSEAFKYVVRARVTEVKDYYNLTVALIDGSIGTTPEKINLSPIWGVSSVSGYKVGDVILVGLNQARGFVIGSGSGVEGSLYTADTIVKAGTYSPTQTPRPTLTPSPASTASDVVPLTPVPGGTGGPCYIDSAGRTVCS